ncbi:MAG: hypothetical protein RLZZ76_529 [Candidatus Parcubacteria bacterium]|jgi:hypothetical protein
MSPQVEVHPLSQNKRRFVFWSSLLLFVLAVPVSVFYATGYRFDFSGKFDSVKRVGGLYVRNDIENTEIFVNNEPVVDMRVFQNAAYIQNLDAGEHRVHVQGEGVQTWVKELPVYAHLVTEVTTFTMPSIPQVRVIAPWLVSTTRFGVVFDDATSTLSGVHITNVLQFSSTTATTTFVENSEYTYIQSLFASSTEQRELLVLQTKTATAKKPTFDVATSSAVFQFATTTKVMGDTKLVSRGADVYAQFMGSAHATPYYYCLQYQGVEQTALQYGQHVFDALLSQVGSSTVLATELGGRLCRNAIKIDRLRQTVSWFDFYPDNSDLVLMLLEDGLYVVEVDDRGWQNTQKLYPGSGLSVIVDGGRIFVKDRDLVLEVFTEVIATN